MDNFVEEKRLRKKTTFESPTCPICGITIRENELENHYRNELEKLSKVKKIINKNNSPQTSPTTSSKHEKEGEHSGCSSKNDTVENCWGTYQKIKENRVRRTSKVICSKLYITSWLIKLIFKFFTTAKEQKA